MLCIPHLAHLLHALRTLPLQDSIYETVPPRFDGKAQAYLAVIKKNA